MATHAVVLSSLKLRFNYSHVVIATKTLYKLEKYSSVDCTMYDVGDSYVNNHPVMIHL